MLHYLLKLLKERGKIFFNKHIYVQNYMSKLKMPKSQANWAWSNLRQVRPLTHRDKTESKQRESEYYSLVRKKSLLDCLETKVHSVSVNDSE